MPPSLLISAPPASVGSSTATSAHEIGANGGPPTRARGVACRAVNGERGTKEYSPSSGSTLAKRPRAVVVLESEQRPRPCCVLRIRSRVGDPGGYDPGDNPRTWTWRRIRRTGVWDVSQAPSRNRLVVNPSWTGPRQDLDRGTAEKGAGYSVEANCITDYRGPHAGGCQHDGPAASFWGAPNG
ncbi:hypothetical protein BGZ61DRAFT_521531 [Ilyonectria robusta]|uniref:uncharacterized protein n=1 Tax=Ilyonectria robusta TaxID=1079257 RepID=UPI001E8E5592|nr:uncharacterized protein BGZ61DRAFT_521531 [Ilyonectria robusta]KAH8670539.1 hypothetical protein BGZ61DRAFT_521531 [Ilyonectria robusta]